MREFLTRLLCGPRPHIAFRDLAQRGELNSLLPEVAAMIGVSQPPEYHPEGDVFEHTMLMLEHMAYPDPLLGWSVLLHDVGKPLTRSVEASGRIRFFCHEEKGAALAEDILKRFGFPGAERDVIVHAVRNHMRFAYVKEMRKSKVEALMRQEHFGLELELHRLDCISCHRKMECFDFLLQQLCSEEPETGQLLSGRDLIALGISPGREMGGILRRLKQLQGSGEILSRQQALEYVRQYLLKQKGYDTL